MPMTPGKYVSFSFYSSDVSAERYELHLALSISFSLLIQRARGMAMGLITIHQMGGEATEYEGNGEQEFQRHMALLPQAGLPPAFPVVLLCSCPPLPRSSVPACTTMVRYLADSR